MVKGYSSLEGAYNSIIVPYLYASCVKYRSMQNDKYRAVNLFNWKSVQPLLKYAFEIPKICNLKFESMHDNNMNLTFV